MRRSEFWLCLFAVALATSCDAPGTSLSNAGQRKPPPGELIPANVVLAAQRERQFLGPERLTPQEAAIVERLAAYLKTHDIEKRTALAATIAQMPSYQPEQLSNWLHLARARSPENHQRCGEVTTQKVTVDKVPTDAQVTRSLAVRLPKAYTSKRPWPMILCFHPTGCNGAMIINLIRDCLGDQAESYILAGPDDYRPLNIDSRRCISQEPLILLTHLRRTYHVDADRIYAVGYSQGGYAAWSMATFYGDQLAGAIPIAASFDAAPELPGLWETLLPNVRLLPILTCWGTRDAVPVLGFDLRTPQGSIDTLNERLLKLTSELKLNVSHWRVTNGGHSLEVPSEEALKLLQVRRNSNPAQTQHRFRHQHQGSAAWLQGLAWAGPHWEEAQRSFAAEPGESSAQTLARGIRARLALLEGVAVNNRFTLRYERQGRVALWLHDGLIDWSKPIQVTAQGRPGFEGTLTRDLDLCLEEARSSGDFDRLRWARLVFDQSGQLEKKLCKPRID